MDSGLMTKNALFRHAFSIIKDMLC